MSIPTHYATLGLAPSAPDAVIRAAYKALALTHHPDKTLQLSPDERAHHAALFRAAQEAYDVLGGPSKRAYDNELARHGNRVDLSRSTFHRAPTPQKTSSTTPKRSTGIRMTTPEEKRAWKAKAEEDLAYLRERRARRDAEDANMDLAALKFMHKTWQDLYHEHSGNASCQAVCTQRIEAYATKIAVRKREHADWLNDMSQAKASQTPVSKPASSRTPDAPRKPAASRFSTASANTVPLRSANTAAPRTAPMRQRMEEKARKEAAKQADLDAKAEAIRAHKEQMRLRAEEKAQYEAERIATARAKAAPARKDSATAAAGDDGDRVPKRMKLCAKCGGEHATFKEWHKCTQAPSSEASGVSEGGDEDEDEDELSFFVTV
jgi:curved DNA-binding protein CbpA